MSTLTGPRAPRVLAISVVLIVAGVSLGGQSGRDGQAPPRADAAISGVVRDGATGQPIADAIVQLGSIAARDFPDVSQRALTDARGRFVFLGLPAGTFYTILAQKSGYFDGAFGALRDTADTMRPIHVADGQWISSADITLWKPGSITGTVVDERGEPVIGVFVRLLGRLRVAGRDHLAAGPLAMTDDRGMYRLAPLRPGQYSVMVPSVQAAIPVSALPPAPAPAPGVRLAPTSSVGPSGASFGGATPAAASPPSLDAGANTHLVLGAYPVPPPPKDGQWFTYPIAFAGASALGQAPAVLVEAGVERTGVDIRLEPVPAVRITGIVEGPPDAIANLTLRLLPEGLEELGLGSEAATTRVAADGSFAFVNVPAGTYTIDAPLALNEFSIGGLPLFYAIRLPRPPGIGSWGSEGGPVAGAPPGFGFSSSTSNTMRGFWARTTVTAGPTGASGIVVRLRPAITMRGRLVGEADPAQPAPATPPSFVSLETATGNPHHGRRSSASVRNVPAGEFAVENIVPGTYVLRGSSSPWMIKSVISSGRDYTYAPFDLSAGGDVTDVVVTFTNAVPSISGMARDAAGAPAADAVVIVFPVEPGQWTDYGLNPVRIKTALTSTAGAFRLRSIPAGAYFVVAVPAARAAAWREDGFFSRLSGLATRVSIAWGQQQSIDVKLIERW